MNSLFSRLMTAACMGSSLALAAGPAAAQDLSNYCDPQGQHVVFLVDQTEAYDRIDRQRFLNGAVKVFDALRPGDQLDIYPLTNQPGSINPFFQVCVPGCPDELSADESNWETTCARVRIQRDKRDFQERFVNIIQFLERRDASADGTEIIRTLQQLAFEYPPRTIDRLVIFSDMLEFSSLNRRIGRFDQDDASSLLNKARDNAPKEGAYTAANVIAYGFAKRLGQGDIIEEQIARLTAEGMSERNAEQLAAGSVELEIEAANSFRGFWGAYFTDVISAKSFVLGQNHP